MFDKLEDLLIRFEEIMGELNEPDVTANQERFRALMKEQSDLTPIVEAYREYKKCNQDIEDSLMMLDEENDPDMREMLKELSLIHISAGLYRYFHGNAGDLVFTDL